MSPKLSFQLDLTKKWEHIEKNLVEMGKNGGFAMRIAAFVRGALDLSRNLALGDSDQFGGSLGRDF